MLHRLALNSRCGADPECAILLSLRLQSDWDDRPLPSGATRSYIFLLREEPFPNLVCLGISMVLWWHQEPPSVTRAQVITVT